jgi:hypothetical protein
VTLKQGSEVQGNTLEFQATKPARAARPIIIDAKAIASALNPILSELPGKYASTTS